MKINYVDIKNEIQKSGLSLKYETVTCMHVYGVYHSHDWDHGYESGTGFMGNRRDFYTDLSETMAFLKKYIREKKINEFIVAPFHKMNQFDVVDYKNDIYQEIKEFLKMYGVKKHSKSGVKLSVAKIDVIEMILEGAFRGISELCIFFPEVHVLIAPNHHFGIPFFLKDNEKDKELIKLILKDFQNLKYYERN